MSDTQPSQFGLLTDQAEQFRKAYPELYTVLAERQRAMRRALGRIPHPDDSESVAPVGVVDAVIGQLRLLTSGIDDLLAGSDGGNRR